ncbi:MAG: phage virion morphogenesis protein [Rhizobiaceae bacterium]|nr:phage virion morphogenesis protein [Rhizobiaceae bacterium]MCC0000965.1 phage virion morphogenesis protein [Methylobacteriaceae bacterium]
MVRSVNIRFSTDLLEKRLKRLIKQAHDITPAMQESAAYMVRATQNRILRSKTSPSGKVWAPNGTATIDIKGRDSPLFRYGNLADGIEAQRVTKGGFTIASTARSKDGVDYGALMQKGIPARKMKGWIKRKKVPARPFLGFSEANIKRLAKILQEHLMGG